MTTNSPIEEHDGDRSGYDVSRFNALRHGILSKFTVLSWEDREEYDALHAAFAKEHDPVGPTEEHLVEELAGIVWRKRRLRLAEAATFRRGLKNTIDDLTLAGISRTAEAALVCDGRSVRAYAGIVTEVIHSHPRDAVEEARESRTGLAQLDIALRILQQGDENSYEHALKALHPGAVEWWEESLEESAAEADPDYTANADSLAEWIDKVPQTYIRNRLAVFDNRSAIREQAFGDAFKPKRLESLARYETHLDRKLQRILSMLLKLQELRRQRKADE